MTQGNLENFTSPFPGFLVDSLRIPQELVGECKELEMLEMWNSMSRMGNKSLSVQIHVQTAIKSIVVEKIAGIHHIPMKTGS